MVAKRKDGEAQFQAKLHGYELKDSGGFMRTGLKGVHDRITRGWRR